MVQQMDRQAALVEDRMDAVKEWMLSRNMPRKLFSRVRKYYEHYYTKKSAFPEDEIISSLTPALRHEVTSVLLRDSLGNFPLFALLGIDFQRSVYPHLKPLGYANADVIYNRGDDSDDIYFLRKGIIDVFAGGNATNVLYRLHQGQYFGEESLTHMRRGCTVTSNGWTELWSLTRDVLEDAMNKFPDLVAKLDEFVIAELERKLRLYQLSYRILIGVAKDPEKRAALVIQKTWTTFAAQRAREDSQFAATSRSTHARPSRRLPRHDSGPPGDNGSSQVNGGAIMKELKDVQQQLLTIRRQMSSQSAVMTKLEGQQHAMRSALGSRSKLPAASDPYSV